MREIAASSTATAKSQNGNDRVVLAHYSEGHYFEY